MVTSAVVVPEWNHVRFTLTNEAADAGTILVYDYRLGKWLGKWNVGYATLSEEAPPTNNPITPIHACMHDGKYHVLDAVAGVMYEDSTKFKDDTLLWVPMKFQFSWVKAAEQSGWQRLWRIFPLFERKSAADMVISVDYDYQDDLTASNTWTNDTIATFEKLPIASLNYHVSRQKCTSFSVTLEDASPSDLASSTGEGFTFSGIRFELGVKKGPIKTALVQRS